MNLIEQIGGVPVEEMEKAFEGWKTVQDLEYMSIRDVYECAFWHGVEVATNKVAQGAQ